MTKQSSPLSRLILVLALALPVVVPTMAQAQGSPQQSDPEDYSVYLTFSETLPTTENGVTVSIPAGSIGATNGYLSTPGLSKGRDYLSPGLHQCATSEWDGYQQNGTVTWDPATLSYYGTAGTKNSSYWWPMTTVLWWCQNLQTRTTINIRILESSANRYGGFGRWDVSNHPEQAGTQGINNPMDGTTWALNTDYTNINGGAIAFLFSSAGGTVRWQAWHSTNNIQIDLNLAEGFQFDGPITFERTNSTTANLSLKCYDAANNVLENQTGSYSPSSWTTSSLTSCQDPNTTYAKINVTSADLVLDNIRFNVSEIEPPPPNIYTFPLLQEQYFDLIPANDIHGFGQVTIDDANQLLVTNQFIQPYNPENFTVPESVLDVPFTPSNQYQLLYFSPDPGAAVHSPVAASVESITSLTLDDCTADFNQASSQFWGNVLISLGIGVLTGVPEIGVGILADDMQDYLNDPSQRNYWCSLGRYFTSGMGGGYFFWYALPLGDIVELLDYVSGTTIYYLVADAENYVAVGQNITPGCMLGKTLPLYELIPAYGNLIQERYGLGYGAVWAENEIGGDFNIRHNYLHWPKNDDPCSLAAEGDCINGNDRFQPVNPFWWRVSPLPMELYDPDTGGIILNAGTNASQVIAVSGEEFTITVAAQVEIPNSDDSPTTLNVSLGDTTHSITLPTSGAQIQTVIPLEAYEDSNYGPAAMAISVEQDSGQDGEVLVSRVCVADTETELDPMPECILTDNGFGSTQYWTLNDGATITGGMVTLPNLGNASQQLYLPADNYTVEMRYRPMPQNPAPSSYDYSLHWALFETDGVTVVDAGYWTGAQNIGWEDLSKPMTVTTAGDYIFTIYVPASGSDTLQVDWACLTPENLPIEDPPSGSSGVSCNSCPRSYTGNLIQDVPEAVNWLGCEMEQLYYCDARKIMVATQEGIEDTVRGVGMLGKWLSATATRLMGSFKSATLYLGGYIQNAALRIADGRITVVEGRSLGIWDVINSLITGLRDVLVTTLDNILEIVRLLVNLLGPAVTTLANLIVGVANIIIVTFNLLLTQVMLIPMLGATIVNSFVSAAAMPVPGAPDCRVLSANPICIGIYIADNTIFKGPAGLLIPVLIAAATLWLAIWTMDRFTGAFR